MKPYHLIYLLVFCIAISACNDHMQPVATVMYTCPMPEDSVFSDHPGQCPKCGMELVEVESEHSHEHSFAAVYTCSMHPQIEQESPGKCPICGMDLVKKESAAVNEEPALHTVIKNPDMAVAPGLPVTQLKSFAGEVSIPLYGRVGYDPRRVGNLSSFVSGRIVKLYVTHRFEEVRRGQRIMDIYSPDLQTAQQELLLVLSSDASNKTLVDAAAEKLVLLGMDRSQIDAVIRSRKALPAVSVFSKYSGHIHDAVTTNMTDSEAMEESAPTTPQLSIREGMYVEKGSAVFTIFDHHTMWANFQISADQSASLRIGDIIEIQAEREGNHKLRSTIGFMEPFSRDGTNQIQLRASLKDHQHLPPGTPLQGTVKKSVRNMNVIPSSAITSLGVRNIVYVRNKGMITPKEIRIGSAAADQVEVLAGLQPTDSVIVNGRFLTDNETIIRIKK